MQVLAIDIETGGSFVDKNPIVAIGTCLFNGKTFEKHRFTLDFNITEFEPRSVKQFWSKNMDKLRVFAHDKKSTIKDFANYLDLVDSKYPDLIIISDNSSFDIGFLNYYFSKYLNRKPLQYKLNNDNNYRVITDTDSFYYALLPNPKDNWINNSDIMKKFGIVLDTINDHYPENDAENICKLFVNVIIKLNL